MSASALLENHLRSLRNQNTLIPGITGIATGPAPKPRPSREIYKTAPPSRANREAISVAGIARGFCDMLRTTHPDKIKMVQREKQLRHACEDVFQAYGKLDASAHGGAPDDIDKLNAHWKKHRSSPAVYACMVLAMAADIEATMPAIVSAEKRQAVTALRKALERVYGYLHQYRQTSEELEAYAYDLYTYWKTSCA